MPINSNQKFLDTFKDFSDHYVLIGGTATSFVLNQIGLESRRTKDYDMVIIDEKKDQAFYQALIEFIQLGGYTPNKIDEKGKLYRFSTDNPDYPAIIELFCVTPNWFKSDLRTAPVHFDDDMSLSALLLDEEYYSLLENGRIIVDGYSVLDNKHLIIFKAKAWLDLTQKKELGEIRVDSKNIKKHLNDIARLVGSLTDTEKLDLSETVQEDMRLFLELLMEKVSEIPQNQDILLGQKEIYETLNEFLTSD